MKKLTKRQIALREKCIAESDDYFKKEWSRPGFAKGLEAFRQEYAMNVAMYKAKKESGLTQSAIAERMGIPRPNVLLADLRELREHRSTGRFSDLEYAAFVHALCEDMLTLHAHDDIDNATLLILLISRFMFSFSHFNSATAVVPPVAVPFPHQSPCRLGSTPPRPLAERSPFSRRISVRIVQRQRKCHARTKPNQPQFARMRRKAKLGGKVAKQSRDEPKKMRSPKRICGVAEP